MEAFKTLLLGTPPTRTYTASATGLLTSANNLSDVADAATARTNLGVAAKVGSSTDNAIVRFDGTGGQQQNSGVTIDDSGNITVNGTGPNTFSGGGAVDRPAVKLTDSTLAAVEWNTSSSTANQRIWQWQSGSAVGDGVLRLRAINDALSNGSNAIVMNRSSENVTSVSIASGLIATPSGTSILGTTTNDNAATGYVGEYVSAELTRPSAISLTTATAANVTSISLTAGDWDVSAIIGFKPGTTTTQTRFIAAISSTSATLPDINTWRRTDVPLFGATDSGGLDRLVNTPSVRLSLSGTTTVYLVAYGEFGASTLEAFGNIRARRVR